MANYLEVTKKQQVISLLELGWIHRRIETETGIRRETVSRYDRQRRSNAAKVFPGSERPDRAASARYRDVILKQIDKRLTVQRIWQDLVEDYGYGHSYESFKRFVRGLGTRRRVVGVFHTATPK